MTVLIDLNTEHHHGLTKPKKVTFEQGKEVMLNANSSIGTDLFCDTETLIDYTKALSKHRRSEEFAHNGLRDNKEESVCNEALLAINFEKAIVGKNKGSKFGEEHLLILEQGMCESTRSDFATSGTCDATLIDAEPLRVDKVASSQKTHADSAILENENLTEKTETMHHQSVLTCDSGDMKPRSTSLFSNRPSSLYNDSVSFDHSSNELTFSDNKACLSLENLAMKPNVTQMATDMFRKAYSLCELQNEKLKEQFHYHMSHENATECEPTISRLSKEDCSSCNSCRSLGSSYHSLLYDQQTCETFQIYQPTVCDVELLASNEHLPTTITEPTATNENYLIKEIKQSSSIVFNSLKDRFRKVKPRKFGSSLVK